MFNTHMPVEAGLRGVFPRAYGVSRARRRAGFTLIEIMVVVMIIGIVGAIGIPSIFRSMQKEGMRKAISDIEEVCHHARRVAIFTGKTTELILRRKDHTISVNAPGGAGEGDAAIPSGTMSVRLPESVRIEAVNLYGLDYTDDEEVRVRFKPNGTAEEFQLVLRGDDNEMLGIGVDLITARVEVVRDLKEWMR